MNALTQHDVVVVGGGISGLTFAFESARAGHSTLVMEQTQEVGGCFATHRARDGCWFELGGHTCYNSYLGLIGMIEACGLRSQVMAQEPVRLRLLNGDTLLPGVNFTALARVLDWGELLRCIPGALTARKDGRTVRSYYSRLVGRWNYETVVRHILSAAPSQDADGIPATMLMKSRATRRKDFPGAFTLSNGLRTIAESIARQAGIEVALGQRAVGLEASGDRYAVVTADGQRHAARIVALAVPPAAAASLLRGPAPELAAEVARIAEVIVDTLGFAVPARRVKLPLSGFIVPRDDMFRSIVTRDCGQDWRGFTFHFRPGHSRDAKLQRAAAVLHLEAREFEHVVERRTILPAPELGHERVVAAIDRIGAASRLCLTGNWFAGLAIEDCVERSTSEWRRVAGL